MAGRRRTVVLVGLLLLALAGAAAFASQVRNDAPLAVDGAAPTGAVAVTTMPATIEGNGTATAVLAGPPTTGQADDAAPSSETTASPASAASSTTTGPAPAPTTAADGPAGGTAPLAGRIGPGGSYSGVATFYDADGGGACLYDHPSADLMVAAMNTRDYETSKACGARVQVRAADGSTITVRIVDECPGDCQVGQIDLSEEAFARLADPSLGRIPITWSLVSPDLSGLLAIRYKDGSSQYWCGLQVIDHRNPIARLEVSANGAFKALERTSYNYFLSPDGSGCGSTIRITDIYGESLTIPALAIEPGATQRTSVQFARH